MKKTLVATLMAVAGLALAGTSMAAEQEHAMQMAHPAGMKVKMEMLGEKGNKDVGYVELVQTKYGLALFPHMEGLNPGMHGFHIHAGDSCGPTEKDGKTVLGGAALGHYDPAKTGKHGYSFTDDNHKGDLPALYVDEKGVADYPVLAPRLTLDEVKGHAIMVHAGGDNHSDHPKPLGGGGARYVCGVVAK